MILNDYEFCDRLNLFLIITVLEQQLNVPK